MDATVRADALATRERLVRGGIEPAELRARLLAVPALQRDPWLDLVLGIEGVPEDGVELPRGCVPYLPCSVDVLLRMIDAAGVSESDLFVDIGSGLGRALLLTHLLTRANALGIEVQPQLVAGARALAARLKVSRCSIQQGDASALSGALASGSVFFLYCPFAGPRLAALLDALEGVAGSREIRICAADLPLPPRPWLTRLELPWDDLAVYRSRGLVGQ
ncbi:MAG TPA: hypothetical protein VFS67_01530 [Polyangiaceae bacterium]|jgi:hypothetical protein|nr:hypothetical protein [Polyangiaceae bacterium]